MSADLAPNPDLANGGAVELGRLLESWAEQGFRELSNGELEELSGHARGKLRGLLHAGWTLGWVRPVCAPGTSRIVGWEVDPGFARLAELFRKALDRRLQQLRADMDDFTRGSSPFVQS